MMPSPINEDDLPYSPIPSLSGVRCKVFLDFSAKEAVRSSFGVPTASVTLYECPDSGMRFRTPPSQEEIEAYYGSDYHRFYGAGSPQSDDQSEAAREPEAPKLEYADRVEFLQQFCEKGRVLDIGCSTGLLAEQMLNAGFDVSACDISEDACRIAEGRIGKERVYCGALDDVARNFPEAHFDAITLMDVIEHVVDIPNLLQGIGRLLRPGGLLFLRTPTLDSPFFRLADLSYRLSFGRYRKAIQRIYHNEHLYFFNEKSIRLLLEDSGFEAERIVRDPLRWRTFAEAELRHGACVNAIVAMVYFASRLAGGGHGMKVIARRAKA